MNNDIRSPKSKEMWLHEGKEHFIAKRFEKALHACQQAIHLDSNYIEAYIGKGIILFNMKRYEDALPVYKRVIRLDPKNAKIYAYQGETLYRLRSHKNALAAYKQAALLDPAYKMLYDTRKEGSNGCEPYRGFGVVDKQFISIQKPNPVKKNIAHKQPILDQKPNPVKKNIAHKQTYRNKKQESTNKNIAQTHPNPVKSMLLFDEGKKLAKTKHYREACEVFEQAIKFDLRNSAIYAAKGAALFELNAFKEAGIAYQQAIQFNNDFKTTYEAKTKELLDIGKEFDTKREHSNAYDAYEWAVKFNPNNESATTLKNHALKRLISVEEKESAKELWREPFRYEM